MVIKSQGPSCLHGLAWERISFHLRSTFSSSAALGKHPKSLSQPIAMESTFYSSCVCAPRLELDAFTASCELLTLPDIHKKEHEINRNDKSMWGGGGSFLLSIPPMNMSDLWAWSHLAWQGAHSHTGRGRKSAFLTQSD